MNVLHICSDYPYQNLYPEFMASLDNIGLRQTVYIPLKTHEDIGKKECLNLKGTKYLYSVCFTNLDRFFYQRKVKKIAGDLSKNVEVSHVNLIHAHFLFSLGGIALLLKKTKGIDYVVSVRNVDLNIFFKYAFWLRHIGLDIMRHAKAVIFISPAYRHKVLEEYVPKQLRTEIGKKTIIIPNGINEFWLNNKVAHAKILDESEIRLLYVGEIARNKNIETTIKVVKGLMEKGYKVTLKIVGGGSHAQAIKALADTNKDSIRYYGHISEREELMNIYRESDIFIMPSFYETFGVAFIEAMSQGLPLIYTKGQGIDGYFPDGEIGVACHPTDVAGIVQGIQQIIEHYAVMSAKCLDSVDFFSWTRIAHKYDRLYASLKS